MSDQAAFMAGRDLAVEMMVAGDCACDAANKMAQSNEYRDGGSFWLCAEERFGREQDNYALLFVQRLLERPELAEGFAAVLSDLFGSLQIGTPSVAGYAEPTFEEMRGEAHHHA